MSVQEFKPGQGWVDVPQIAEEVVKPMPTVEDDGEVLKQILNELKTLNSK